MPYRQGNEHNLLASFMIREVSTDSDYMDHRDYEYHCYPFEFSFRFPVIDRCQLPGQ